MKVVYIKGRVTQFSFNDSELAVAMNVLAGLIDQCTGKSEDELRLHAILTDMQFEIRKRVEHHNLANRFKVCQKCFREIDTQKDRYQRTVKHTQFETGYEIFVHQDCPPVNQGKGYEK